MLVYMTLIEEPKHRTLFEELYWSYRQAMFGVAVAVLRDHHLAEDAVSESFVKIATHMPKIAAMDQQERKDYIVIITRNSAVDIYRQRQQQEGAMDFLEELPDMMGFDTPDEVVTGKESYDRVVQAICALPTTYRDTMKLYYLFEHTTAEIAELLSVKENTVDARLSRGRKKLAELLAKETEGSAP